MPRNRKQNEAQSHKIYVLLSTISNEFYVGKTTAAKPNVAYKFHAAEKHAQTKQLFAESRKNQNFPKMYLLEEINVTPKTAFGYCVAWTKYFIEQGLTPLANQTVLDYTEDLTEANETVFNCIKAVPIDSVISDEHLLIETYHVQKKKTTGGSEDTLMKQKILLHLSPENYELISYKAKEAKMSMSRYCQMMALDGDVVIIDMSACFNEIRDFKIVLRKILGAILQHGKYYPADLSNIQKLVDKVNTEQEKMGKILERETERRFGYKRLQNENYRLKKEIKELKKENKELKKELGRGQSSPMEQQEDSYEDDKN